MTEKSESRNIGLLKTELYLAPILVIMPIIVSIFLIRDWYYRGFSMGLSTYNGELYLAIIIIIGNLIFGIPFMKSVITHTKK